MAQFRLVSTVTVSAYTIVEADTLDEAIKASERRPVEFADGPATPDEAWLVSEMDGGPQNIEAD